MTSSQPRMLTDTNVEQSIKETAQTDLTCHVIQQLEQALGTIKSTLFDVVLMPKVPVITVRVDTILEIFQGLAEAIPQEAPELLRTIGKRVGDDFTRSVEEYLEDHGFVATHPKVLLKVWNMLDKGANWGQFESVLQAGKVNVSLKESSLLKGEASNASVSLWFLEGYVFGVIWELFKYYRRRLLETGMVTTEHATQPLDVKGEFVATGQARFELPLRQEELESIYDMIYRVRQLIRRGEGRKIGVEIRTVLENALKAKVNAPLSEDMSVPDLTKGYRKEMVDRRVTFNFNRLDAIWHRTSPDSHGEVNIALKEAAALLGEVEKVVNQLELLPLGEKHKQNILAHARERRDKRRSPQVSVSARDSAIVQVGIGDIVTQQVEVESEKIRKVFEILATIQERLDTEDPKQGEAKSEIDAILQGSKSSWKDLRDKASAIIRKLADVASVGEFLLHLSELLRS